MPLYQISGPDGKIYQIEGPEGATREQVIQAIQMRMAEQQAATPRITEEPKEEQGTLGMIGSAFVRGAKQTGSLLADVLPAQIASAVGADEYAKKQMAEAAETQKEIQEKYAARYPTLESVEGIGDYIPFALETIAEQVPNIAASVIPGVGVAGLAGRAALAGAATRGLTGAAAQTAARAAAIKGAGAGAFLGSYALNSPEIFQNIYEETGKLTPGAAAIAGSVAAALDSILPAALASKLSGNAKASVVEKILERSGMKPGIARGATAGVIGGVATEGPTEAAQEAISIAAEKFVADNEAVWGSKEFNRLVEAGVRGAVGGGGISGVFGAVEGAGQRTPEIAPEIQDPRLRDMQTRLRAEVPDLGTDRRDVAVDTGRGELGVESVVGTAPRVTEGVEPSGVSALGGVEDIPETTTVGEEPSGAPLETEEQAKDTTEPERGFKTEKGSTYSINEQGKTSRTKRSEGKGQGTTYAPHSVLYVDAKDTQKILEDMQGGALDSSVSTRLGYLVKKDEGTFGKIVTDVSQIPDGVEAAVFTVNKKENKLVGFYKAKRDPAVGLAPVEKLYNDDGTSNTHIGNKIVELFGEKKQEKPAEAQQAKPTETQQAKPTTPPSGFDFKQILNSRLDLQKEQQRSEKARTQALYDEYTNTKGRSRPEVRTALRKITDTAASLFNFIQSRGVDPNNIPSNAPQEIKDAATILGNLGADSLNILNKVRQDQQEYVRAADKKAFNAKPKTAINKEINLSQGTITAADAFLKDPSVGTGQNIVFSRQAKPGGRGMKAAAVQDIISQVRDAFANAPMARAVQTVNELPSDIQQQIADVGIIPKGLYNTKTGEIFLIADYLSGPTDVFITLAHETVGHFGLRAILGANYSRVMGEIYNGNADIRVEVDAILTDNPNMDRDIAVEEALALRAEAEVRKSDQGKKFSLSGAIKQLINYIRRLARSIGIPLKNVTDIEITELIANSRRFVEKGEIGFDRFTEGVAADQPLAARTAREIEEGRRAEGVLPSEVILQDAAWSPERINRIISENTYPYPESDRGDGKAWVAFVNPQDFLDATATETDRARIEKEKTPLDRERLAKYDMPIYLNLDPKTVDIEDGFGVIVGHEGRHRMAALRDAGITKVPVVLYNGYGGSRVKNAKSAGILILKGQDFREDGLRTTKEIAVTNVIAVTANNAKYIRREFGSPSASVVFSPAEKKVQAVFSQFQPSSGPTRVNPQNVNSTTEKAAEQRLDYQKAKGIFGIKSLSSLKPEVRKLMLKIMTLRMINDMFGPKVEQIASVIRTVEDMQSMRNNIMKEAQETVTADILKVLKTKNGSDQIQLMGEIATQATMLGVDPDPEGEFHGANKTLTEAWNMLTPEVQKIYRNMRIFYDKQVNGMVEDMIEKVKNNIIDPADRAKFIADIVTEFGSQEDIDNHKVEIARLINSLKDDPAQTKSVQQLRAILNTLKDKKSKRVGPYFPLRRFGDYWFQIGEGESKEFYMFESSFDRDFWMKERVKEFIDEGYTPEEANGMVTGSGDSIGGQTDSLHGALASQALFQKFDNIIDSTITGTDPEKVRSEIKDSLRQLNYLLLPSTNFKKMFIHRKNIPGASTDITRVFSTSAVNIAYQRARNKYAERFYNELQRAKSSIQNKFGPNSPESRVLGSAVAELEERTPHILGIEPTTNSQKIANNLTQFSFLWLLTAPSSAILNTIGMVTVGMPYIAARYGYSQTMGKLLEYGKKYVATAPKISEGTTVAPTLEKTTWKTEIQRLAYERFLHDNLVDASMIHDIMGLGERPTERRGLLGIKFLNMGRVVEGMTFLFHHSERMNREIMSMSVFDLAFDKFKKQGMNESEAFEAAIQEAKDLVTMSLGDFTRAGRAPIFTGPVAKVAFQFKQYSLLMTYNLLRNTHVGFIKNANTPEALEVAKEARKRMYGVLGMTALFAGAKGMPIFGATALMVEAISSLGDDEDEIEDFEYWLDGYLREIFGGTGASIAMRGLVAQAGPGLSERAGLDLMDLWVRDAMYKKTAEDTIKEQMLLLLGPTASIMLTGAKGWDSMQNGQFERGLESMMPAVARNLMVTKRYFDEGAATTRKGITITEDITPAEYVSQALGFTPERILAKQKAIIARKQVQSKLENKKERVLNALYFGWLIGDEELYSSSMDKLVELKQNYPELNITRDTIIKSIKSRYKDKLMQETYGGVDRRFVLMVDEKIKLPD